MSKYNDKGVPSFNENEFHEYAIKSFSEGALTIQEAEEVLDSLKNSLKEYAVICKKY